MQVFSILRIFGQVHTKLSIIIISILIFCLLVLPITKTGVLTSQTITVNLCISPFSFICFCFKVFEALLHAHLALLHLLEELTLLLLYTVPQKIIMIIYCVYLLASS